MMIIWALIQLWGSRFCAYFIDSISYLDMSAYFMAGEWAKGLSTYWNPFYPAIIALIFYVLRPTSFYEFAALKLVNLIIFSFLIVAFEYFLDVLLKFYADQMRRETGVLILPARIWIFLAHAVFAYAFLCLNGIAIDSPDMLMSFFLFFAFAVALKIVNGQSNFKNFMLFGFLGGLGYIAKNVALPVVLTCMFCFWLKRQNIANFWQKLATAIGMLLVIISPYIAFLSQHEGALTISASGKVNYVWYVQERSNNMYGSENESEHRLLKHPPRRIFEKPNVFEFATPVNGTYPLWFDPAYWMQGIKARLDLRQLAVATICNIWYYATTLFFPLIILLIVMLVSKRRIIVSCRSIATNSILLLPSLTGFLEYTFGANLITAPRIVNDRYFSLFIILLIFGTLASLRIQNNSFGKCILKLRLILITLLLLGAIGEKCFSDYKDAVGNNTFEHYQIAEQLKKQGLVDGDRVARIGNEEWLFDWAKLANLGVIIDVPDSAEFWSLSPTRRTEILHAMKKYNVKMAIYFSEPCGKVSKERWAFNREGLLNHMRIPWLKNKPEQFSPIAPPKNEEWQQLNNLQCWVYRIH